MKKIDIMERNYEPMEKIFNKVIEKTLSTS